MIPIGFETDRCRAVMAGLRRIGIEILPERGRLPLPVMAAEGPPSTPFCGIDTARRGCRACARHDGTATTVAILTPMRPAPAMTLRRRRPTVIVSAGRYQVARPVAY
jgi:hypothetical protein